MNIFMVRNGKLLSEYIYAYLYIYDENNLTQEIIMAL